MSFKPRDWLLPVILALIGLVLRLWTLHFTCDFSGDAPSRAVISLKWLLHPHWVSSGYWLPLPCYINALAIALLKDPFNSSRYVSAIFGTVSIPLLYFYVKRVFGQFVAVTSAAALVFFPLHVGLSASGLTEGPSLTYLLASFLLLMRATSSDQSTANNTEKQKWLYLGSSVFFMLLLNLTRAESWGYIPIFVGYFYFCTRRLFLSLIMLTALSWFPLYWLYNCWSDYHVPFLSVSGFGESRVISLSPPEGFVQFNVVLFKHLGPLIWCFGWLGYLVVCRSVIRDVRGTETWREQAFYMAMTSVLLVLVIYLKIHVGDVCQDRYFVFLMIFWIPLSNYMLGKLPYFASRMAEGVKRMRRVTALILASLVVCNSMLANFMYFKPQIFVSKVWPDDLIACGKWLKETHKTDKSMIVTCLDYWVFYLLQQCPELIPHAQVVVGYYRPLLDIRDALQEHHPVYLVTAKNDQPDIEILKTVVKFDVEKPPLYTHGTISVYKIADGSFAAIDNPNLPTCIWYPKTGWITFWQHWKRKTDKQ